MQPDKKDAVLLRRQAEDAAAALPDLMSAAHKAATSILSGEHHHRRPGQGEKFWQFRDFQQGDRPQDIDWRQSAKGDRLFIRQKEWQTTQTTLMWCQNDAGMAYASRRNLPSKRDTAVTLGLAMAILLTRAGELTGTLGMAVTPGRGAQTLDAIGRALLSEHTHPLPDAAHIRMPRHGNLVLIGDFLSESDYIGSCFRSLATHTENALVIQVLDPAEIELPFTGRVLFQQPSDTTRHHVRNVESIQTAYRDRIKTHIDFIQNNCRQHGWQYILHLTDEPPARTLATIWQATEEARA